MNYYKIILSYNGSNYSGWQFQTHNPNTIQQVVEQVLKKIVNFQKISVSAASRTDTGVHAMGQVLKVGLPKDIDTCHLALGLNSKLPLEIRAVDVQRCERSFYPNTGSVSKEYHYYFSTKVVPGSISDIITYFDMNIDILVMQKVCKYFIGEHDFTHFYVEGSRNVNPNRSIFDCSIEKVQFGAISQDIYCFKIIGSGFLKYMVRMIMDFLLKVGTGQILETEACSIIQQVKNVQLHKVKPNGLHLIKVNYQ